MPVAPSVYLYVSPFLQMHYCCITGIRTRFIRFVLVFCLQPCVRGFVWLLFFAGSQFTFLHLEKRSEVNGLWQIKNTREKSIIFICSSRVPSHAMGLSFSVRCLLLFRTISNLMVKFDSCTSFNGGQHSPEQRRRVVIFIIDDDDGAAFHLDQEILLRLFFYAFIIYFIL